MFAASSPLRSRASTFSLAFAAILVLAIATGCGSSGNSSTSPFIANTKVSVLLSSAANAQVTEYDLIFKSITLTGKDGVTATLLSNNQPAEFLHLNGAIEPLAIASIPQGTYSSASITLAGAQFICVEQVPSQNSLAISEFNNGDNAPVTVNLPAPIPITGDSMTLVLDMQVAQSATVPSCYTTPPFEGFSITPTFNLTPLTVASTPTNAANGLVSGMKTSIAATGIAGTAPTLTITAGPYGNRSVYASTSSSTVFQGVANSNGLAVGMFANVDGAIQPDGSLIATRIEVENPTAINIFTGPLLQVIPQVDVLMQYGRQEQGPLTSFDNETGLYWNSPSFNYAPASFRISGQLTNLATLPFVASFTAQNMVPGQMVDVTSGDFTLGGTNYTPAQTVTLIPQAVDGQIESISTVGNFTVYTVSLADYDLFPNLAVQSGQTTLLTNPSQMDIYVDTNTQMTNTQSLSAGNTLLFYGLVFNNGGALSMDCAQISDGVPFTPSSGASSRHAVPAQITRRASPGGREQIVTTVASSH